jgi:hypothetical protein
MYKTPQLEPAEFSCENIVIYPSVSLAQHPVSRSKGNPAGISAQRILAQLRFDGAVQSNSLGGDYSSSFYRRVSSSSVVSLLGYCFD